MVATRPVLAPAPVFTPGAPTPLVTVLVPAHNEADGIPAMVDSLLSQTWRPDRILVVADNCDDLTEGAVSRLVDDTPVTLNLFITQRNQHRKAGALNQALRYVLRDAIDDDLLVIMDADSALDRTWLAAALRAMPVGSPIGAVSGMCRGDATRGALATLQRMEYEQIAAHRTRKGGATRMLSGAGSAFRVRTLREVADARGRELPGTRGDVYNSASLTEDHELTLAVRALGYQVTSPDGCGVRTELLTTWRGLAAQRLRWDRGGLADVLTYGFSRVTLGHIGYQLERLAGVFVHLAVAVLVTLAIVAGGELVFRPWTLGIAVLAAFPAVVGVRRMGWRYMLLAAAVLPQFGYYLFMEVVAVRAYWQTITRRTTTWVHN